MQFMLFMKSTRILERISWGMDSIFLTKNKNWEIKSNNSLPITFCEVQVLLVQ